MQELYNDCLALVSEAIRQNNRKIDPRYFLDTIFAYKDEDEVLKSILVKPHPIAEKMLKDQLVYLASLGIDPIKGKKLVYVKTKNLNIEKDNTKQKVWIKVPDLSESYHALIKVLIEESIVRNIVVIHAYKGYPIEYTGNINDVPVVKSWQVSPSERGEYTGCFVTIYLPIGDGVGIPQTSFHHSADIDATHRKFSKSVDTWAKHQLAMTAKSAIIDALKYIPKPDGLVSSMIERYDQDHDWEQVEPLAVEVEKIGSEQVDLIYKKISDYGINERQFMKWLDSLKIKSVEAIPSKRLQDVLDKIETKRPVEAAA